MATTKIDISKMKLDIDSESINIYIDNGDDEDPTHIVYWHEDEWVEDPLMVVPTVIEAIRLFYEDRGELLRRLGYQL